MKRGFTVVEVLVTLIVIAILLGLGTVGLRATLANGRDSERKSDIETIARSLELRYDRGNTLFVLNTSDGLYNSYKDILSRGAYPSGVEFKYGVASESKNEFVPATNSRGREFLYQAWALSKNAATSPSGNEIDLICANTCSVENAAQLNTTFTSSRTDKYVYEPIDTDGTVCNGQSFSYKTCVRFNLYWISETTTTNFSSAGIDGLQIYRSKHS